MEGEASDNRARRGSRPTETTPLLRSPLPLLATGDQSFLPGDERASTEIEKESYAARWGREVKTLVAWSAPVTATYVLQRSLYMLPVFMVGRIGTRELSAVALSSTTSNLVTNNVLTGLASALDTLAAQAYGAGRPHQVGVHTQRVAAFMALCCVPLAVALWHAGVVLRHAVADAEVVALVQLFLRVNLVRLPAFVLFECGKRFFQAQGIFHAMTAILVFAAPFNAALMWFLVWHLNWGFVGAPVAVVITENVATLLLWLYFLFVDGVQCWGGFTRTAFRDWGPTVRLSLSCMVMWVSETAVEEILTVAAGQLGAAHLAAQSALVTVVQIAFVIPAGLSTAASVRTANWIGSHDTRAAKFASKVAVLLGTLLALLVAGLALVLRHQIARPFSQDVEVVGNITTAMPVVATSIALDAVMTISHGLLRGLGWQESATYFNLFACYGVALPISFGSAFWLGWGLSGLWSGVVASLFLVCVFEYAMLYCSNWNTSLEKAVERVQESY